MREIKFRVWHKNRKKYYEVHHLHCGTIGIFDGEWATCKARDCIEDKDVYIQVQPSDAILEQYTGLKDKNGKEIYEGDVDKEYGRVIWNSNECCYETEKGNVVGSHLEIIGHIHEEKSC